MNETGNENSSNSAIKMIFKFLKESDEKIEFGNNDEKILALGITGSGKSTFLQWIAGDDTKLFARETMEGNEEFIIHDENNKISTSTVTSMTTYPELIRKMNTEFYDCPGFEDTRSTSHDIAITYFIKRIFNSAKSVKIILVINASSIASGNDRQSFKKLLRRATDLIKDVDKFGKSIALVVTKVENRRIKDKGLSRYVSDKVVIATIANFIREAREEMQKQIASEVASEDHKFLQNAVKLCDIFLKKNDNKHTRIGIFRKPDESGRLDQIELMQKGKQSIEKMIYNDLIFTPKINEDFGYTISDESKQKITSLIKEISLKVSTHVDKIADTLNENFQNSTQNQIDIIKTFTADKPNSNSDKSQAREFFIEFTKQKDIMTQLTNDIESFPSLSILVKYLKSTYLELKFDAPEDSFKEILYQEKDFQVLQIVSDINLTPRWTKSFQTVVSEVLIFDKKLEQNSKEIGEQILKSLNLEMEEIAKELKARYQQEKLKTSEMIGKFVDESVFLNVNENDAKSFTENFSKGNQTISNLVKELDGLLFVEESAIMINDKINCLDILLNSMQKMPNILVHANYLEYLKELTGENYNAKPSQWSYIFQNVKQKVSSDANALKTESLSLSEKLSSTMKKDIESIIGSIQKHFDAKTKNFDIQTIHLELENGHDALLQVTKEIKTLLNLKDISEKVRDVSSKMNVTDSNIETVATSIVFKESYMKFLKALNNEVKPIEYSTLIAPFDETINYLKEKENLFNFLRNLYNTFSEFRFQADKSEFDVANIADWGLTGKSRGIKITAQNFQQLLEKIKQYNINGQALIENKQPDEQSLDYLNEVISATLKSSSHQTCLPSGQVLIQGDFIRLSEFIGANGELLKKCVSVDKQHSLKIFAFKTLFVDTDLMAIGEKLQLTIIAPKWEIIGDRKLVLDGQPGESHVALNGNSGANGKAGLPGGPAGSFFGIGGNFINSEKLTITAIGGNGGPGQDGEKGRDGKDGVQGETPSYGDCEFNNYYKKIENSCSYKTTVNSGVYSEERRYCDYETYGTAGTQGLNGGNGGKSGKGGSSGKIELNSLNGPNNVNKKFSDGVDGRAGQGGKGGTGGLDGENVITTCEKISRTAVVIPWEKQWRHRVISQPSNRRSSGTNGSYGTEGYTILPETSTTIENKALILNDFIKKLKDSSRNIDQASFVSFVNSLEIFQNNFRSRRAISQNVLNQTSDPKSAFDYLPGKIFSTSFSQNLNKLESVMSKHEKSNFEDNHSSRQPLFRHNYAPVDSNLLLGSYVASHFAKLLRLKDKNDHKAVVKKSEVENNLSELERSLKLAEEKAQKLGWK